MWKLEIIMQKMVSLGSIGSSERLSTEENIDQDDHEAMSRLALLSLRAKEEEIERKKMEVRDKVQFHLGRAEEETRRLAHVLEVTLFQFSKLKQLVIHFVK